MAERFVLLSAGQSNETPVAVLADWQAQNSFLNLDLVTSRAHGATADRFVMPGSFPGFSQLDLKGLATKSIRYLTFYNPCATGYKTYPCVGRLAILGTHTSTSIEVEQTFIAASNVPFVIVRQRTGTSHNVTAVSNSGLSSGAGAKLTIDSATPWTSPVSDEQFDYPVAVTAGTGTATLTLNLTYGPGTGITGSTIAGALTGLILRCTVGANAGSFRVINSWNNGTRQATVASAFGSAIANTDRFVIEPQQGAFQDFAFWLPWCRYEAGNTTGKVNPYPPGFNYPNHFSIPKIYNYAAGVGGGVHPSEMAYHTGFARKLSQHLGRDIYVLTCGIGGMPLCANEVKVVSDDVGWFDANRQTTWSAGAELDNCFRRMIRQVQAGITAAAKEGDTIRVGLFGFPQGEADGINLPTAKAYYDNARTFRAALRRELKALGVLYGGENDLPIVQPKILSVAQGGQWQYYETLNENLQVLTEEDPAAATFEVDDIDYNGVHVSGAGMPAFEDRFLDGFRTIQKALDRSGEVDICNLALQYLGEGTVITSINPPDTGSELARLVAAQYPACRDYLLECHAWGFAMKRRTLYAVDSTSEAYSYAYILPGDVAQVLSVQSSGAQDDTQLPIYNDYPTGYIVPGFAVRVPQNYVIEQDSLGRRVILTNESEALIRYVAYVRDTRRFPALFKEALVIKLAAELARPVLKAEGGAKAYREMMQAFAYTIGKATVSDAQQTRETPRQLSSWHAGMA